MAKSIKFNLIVDNTPIRDIDDLRKNFNLDDILDHYKSGFLLRWLEVRNLNEYCEKIQAISSDKNVDIAKNLCNIFLQNIDKSIIHSSVYHLEYKIQNENKILELKKCNFLRNKVISDYHTSYLEILQRMIEEPENYPLIKSSISEIWNSYKDLFYTDFNRFFDDFYNKCNLGLFSIISNEKFRNSDIFDEKKCALLFEKVKSLFPSKKLSKNINLIDAEECEIKYPFASYSGETDEYWKDIEPKGKPCMILRIETGNYVRNARKNGEELGAEHINGKFIVLDGIDYKSKYAADKLFYMEL